MFETILRVFLILMGAWLVLAGMWLWVQTFCDISRCRRLIFYHIVQLFCAGSAIALGMWTVL